MSMFAGSEAFQALPGNAKSRNEKQGSQHHFRQDQPSKAVESPQLSSDLLHKFQWFEEQLHKDPDLGIINRIKRVKRQWPNNHDLQMQFLEWAANQHRKIRDSYIPTLSPDEFIKKTVDTRFADANSRASWHWMMEMGSKPFYPIGTSTHGNFKTGYGIEPGPAYLLPHGHNPLSDGRGDRLDHSVLGLNLKITASPGDAGRDLPPNALLNKSCSDTPEDDGFVFAQLGALWAFHGDKGWPKGDVKSSETQKIIRAGPWKPTGFGVVVRLNKHGRPGAVYVIYNFWGHGQQPNDFSRIQHKDSTGALLPHIGNLHPKCNPQSSFCVAKIANTITGLSVDKAFEFKIKSRRETHICPVIQSNEAGRDIIVREYLAAPERQK